MRYSMASSFLLKSNGFDLCFSSFVFQKENYLCAPFLGKVLTNYADVVKLVDTPDLGSGAVRCVGSSPSIRTSERGSCCKAGPFFC